MQWMNLSLGPRLVMHMYRYTLCVSSPMSLYIRHWYKKYITYCYEEHCIQTMCALNIKQIEVRDHVNSKLILFQSACHFIFWMRINLKFNSFRTRSKMQNEEYPHNPRRTAIRSYCTSNCYYSLPLSAPIIPISRRCPWHFIICKDHWWCPDLRFFDEIKQRACPSL